jgi:hypothetical protein
MHQYLMAKALPGLEAVGRHRLEVVGETHDARRQVRHQ